MENFTKERARQQHRALATQFSIRHERDQRIDRDPEIMENFMATRV